MSDSFDDEIISLFVKFLSVRSDLLSVTRPSSAGGTEPEFSSMFPVFGTPLSRCFLIIFELVDSSTN